MTFIAGFEKLPRKDQVWALFMIGIDKPEIAVLVGLSRCRVYRMMKQWGIQMKKCKFIDTQEKCRQYNETSSRPGIVNLTCWFYREIWKDNWKCTAPPPGEEKKAPTT